MNSQIEVKHISQTFEIYFLIFFSFLIFNSHFLILHSQPVTQEWVRNYTGGDYGGEGLMDMVLDTGGNIYATGRIYTIAQNNNFCTIKYNSTGVQQWVALYNGPGSNSVDQAVAIVIDKKGYIYVTGNSDETGAFTDAYCTIKYSSSGTQMWVARYSRTPHIADDPKAIAVDKNGNVYVTGNSIAPNSTRDYLTVKYDSLGNLKWAKYYDGPVSNDDISNSISVDDSCNVYITGESATYQNTSGFCTIKYNTNGDSLWVRRYEGMPGGGYPNGGNKLILDKWNNVYAAGFITELTHVTQFCVLKYSSSGVQQWVSIDHNTQNQGSQLDAIAIDSLLNVYITGYSYFNNYGNYATIKYNSTGVQQWAQYNHIESNSYDESKTIIIDQQNNIYITGLSNSTNPQFVTIKYNSSGVQQWLMIHDGRGYAIKVDKNYNVYVAGSNFGCTTIKYSQLIGINPISREIPFSYNLYQNYPNPFNPTTKIKFDVTSNMKREATNVKLVIYDILGREVVSLVNQKLQPGTYEVEFNGTNFPSGVYFYKITTESFSETRRMVILK